MSANELPPGALVHITERRPDPSKPAILPDQIFVNGVDVGLLKSFTVWPGSPSEPTVVTLELLPREVIIGRAP